jgi:Cytochrome oxidase complex assembly protein 1
MNPLDMNPPQQKGWFGRNWKWFVPVGCLSMVLVVVAVVAAVIYFAFGAMKSSEVYQEALTKTKSNQAVVRELGEPIEAGWQISGSFNVSGDSGNADVKIPVSGPKKSGSIYATAIKRQGKWDFSALEVEIEGESKRINLLAPSSE